MRTQVPPRAPNHDADRKAPTNPMLEIVKRNPRSVATAIGGIIALAASSIWMLRSLGRGTHRD